MLNNPHTVAPSTLSDVIGAVKAMFALAGVKVPIQVGSQYLSANQGTGPRVLFVPEPGNGRILPPIQMGFAVKSRLHGCEVRVREWPGKTEEETFAPVDALSDKVIAALSAAGTGRIEFSGVRDTSITPANTMGVEIAFTFTFQRDIPNWDRLWALPEPVTHFSKEALSALALSATTPPTYSEPTGLAVGTGTVILPTTVPEDP